MSPQRVIIAASAILCLILSGSLQATDWYVDLANCPGPGNGNQGNPFCRIQDGIDAATNGDRVIVLPGTYLEHIDFRGKAVEVLGRDGQRATILNAAGPGSGVAFRMGEGRNSILRGFTIQNGTGTLVQLGSSMRSVGGGILCQGTSPTIAEVVLANNTAQYGGGIGGVFGASPLLEGVELSGNTASTNGGGACFMVRGTPLMEKCVFRANRCNHTGGGLNFRNSCFPVLRNCLFDRNDAVDMGGGIRAGALSGCTFEYCTFYANTSRYGGGIAAGSDTSGTVHRTTICNSIFWGNRATHGPEISLNGRYAAIIDCDFSDLPGGRPRVYVQNATFQLILGGGMIDANPAFVNAAGGDFRLAANSPCIDTGDPAAAPGGLDLGGNPRCLDGDLDGAMRVDMGAHEFDNVHLAITGAATPGGSIQIDTTGRSGMPFALLLGLASGENLVPPYGALFLDLTAPWMIVAIDVIPRQWSFALPLVPRQVTLYLQDLAVDLASGAGNTSNPVELRIR